MQNFSVDYVLRETSAHVRTRRKRFTQDRQFGQVSCNCCAKERCLPSNKVNDGPKTPIGHVYERKNRLNPGIPTITNRCVSNSECGPVCNLKTVNRPRVTTPYQDRYLVVSAGRQRGSTARAVGSALTVAT
ncbi:hypothetical protein TNCV_3752981 [Trichonephila clavipes]|nr:hypothetical protein TNCV_3752981 [Trichonephila clavipes]